MQFLDVPLSSLFPNLFTIFRPVATADLPLMVAASMLADYEHPIVPVRKGRPQAGEEKKGVKLFKAIGGQQVLRLIVKTKPSDYEKMLWGPCSDASIWLGAVEYEESLGRLLQVFDLTGFGDARVNAKAPPHGLISLEEVVSLYRERRLRCELRLEEVASQAISVDPEETIIHAMTTMCDRRVRRLFLSGRKDEYISDRSVLAFLFSPRLLTVAKDSPESWTSAKVAEVQATRARAVSPKDKVEEVGRLADADRDVFTLAEGALLVSRWDLVMKPWKMGRLQVSP
jgi:hypothetical protein